MGRIDPVVVVAAAAAFLALGGLWYGPLFGKAWQRAAGLSSPPLGPGDRALRLSLAFLFTLLISLTLAHQYAMTGPSARAMMMIAFGFGAMLMAPALGIAYLLAHQSGRRFALDAGFFVAGTTLMGAVHVILG